MNKRSKTVLTASALAVTLAGAGLVFADRDTDGHHFKDTERCDRGGHHRHTKRWFGSARYLEGKLAFVRTELQITPEQEPAWQRLEALLKDLIAQRSAARDAFAEQRESGVRKDLVTRLDRRIAMMESTMAQLRDVSAAVKDLYAELDPEQREIAESLSARRRL